MSKYQNYQALIIDLLIKLIKNGQYRIQKQILVLQVIV